MTSTLLSRPVEPAVRRGNAMDRRVARDLLVHVEPAHPDHTNEDIAARFAADRSLQNLPVTFGRRPMGLINRSLFHNMMAKPFYPELYSRQSCIAFMDKSPLVADAGLAIHQLTALAIQAGEKVFADGFILVEDGEYVGVGQMLDLMQAMTELQERQHRQLRESIDYASILQASLLKPSCQALKDALPERHWLCWRPRDVVGGDFYHFLPLSDGFLLGVFDCTGHGVPGAFMTLIAVAALERALAEQGTDDPAALLQAMNRRIKQSLNQQGDCDCSTRRLEDSDDGLDGAILRFYASSHQACYAGAHMPLFRVTQGAEPSCEQIKGDRAGVGYTGTHWDQAWGNQTLECHPGERLYLVSDGVIDQIGGDKRIAFGKKRLRQCLLETHHLTLPEQGRALEKALDDYRGEESPRDDITLIALALPDGPHSL
ncbi:MULTISPECIES: SpoIIE family protein phosphatase [unclassified Ectothiorhodospira]|uniref:SpoIIE family protein phosphatase n=1 Tax=unclassified Ectothiorhodospira TaxID=2684909 RepID=UPI001EE8E48F|nr:MULTISPECIES: SpoIIE family protein phosphatase [unclassified Ectothiorhodospira]MCG5516747.1 SpoIIE family protein phosphatase [Ectothiorhodospira sp. 9100]MCG5519187.1 SpoIIE family protein phosphatase [Ectothiorhodospira sp. 9905]